MRGIFAAVVHDMLAFVEIFETALDMLGPLNALIKEVLDTQQEFLALLELNTNGPGANLYRYNCA
jgi:hypothetical protein